MRVVVTGATSMIGVSLIKECVSHGDEVLAIVREGSSKIYRLPDSELIKVKYADLDSLDQVSDGDYDVFYHFAWGHTDKSERDDPVLQEKNIATTLDAVKLAEKLHCKKFIGAGSQAEYGIVNTVIDENTECNPKVAYGMAKLAAGMLSRKKCEEFGIKHIWTRIFSVYGVNDAERVMIKYAIRQFMKNEDAYFSSATNTWNYLNEKDAGIIFYLLGSREVKEGIYCVASDESKELKSYIRDIQRIVNTQSKCIFDNNNCGQINLNVDISKLKSANCYESNVSFEDGIKEIYDFYSKSKEMG